MANTMVIQQPKPFVQAITSNQWSSDICDCTKDMSSCCLAFWCFPCFACITAREAGECLCLPLLNGFGLIPPATMSLRVGIRQRYGIEGTMCNDCVYSFFCGPCTWCQMSREMKTRLQPVTLINHMKLLMGGRLIIMSGMEQMVYLIPFHSFRFSHYYGPVLHN